MLHTITCAVRSNNILIKQQLIGRFSSAGIKVIDRTVEGSQYLYFDLCWDDADALPVHVHVRPNRRAGAKPRQL